ncbi:MAG: UDP-N-acetylglucosamine--N-acetylmuramyl-(pentapeptide) pyrophosphoryl-undecaprenol N-acetylglucosamine transferase [Oscillospiraceae bacterium]|jgi:UDP-N-acetylglucosamine--N-acetylmuramyl-(pentapeptide) pyrophosphoryl-undecaprenol N-acetylglucosamine transferase|nr:UDP-N-acetylglucosamine--N-acetylmuramyl-(pentapeptide) pyrophosphoryl-undecaprenol N-acetylglucosamine transferase [Oscillospiraceae bacterium]
MGARIIFVCGGSAGHVNPALAVADEIKEMMPDSKLLFIGAGRSIESRLVPAGGYELVNLKVSGLLRSFSPRSVARNAAALRDMAAAFAEAERLLRDFRPDAVFGTGGYVCYPVLKKACKLGIPTLIHEPNALPGLATRLLSGKVDRILTAFPADGWARGAPGRTVVVGTPVRGGFATLPAARERELSGARGEKRLLVSFWGSLGAEKMNSIMAEFIAINARERAFRHIHATGGGEPERGRLLERLRGMGVGRLPDGIEVRAYIDDMASLMALADLVMCRAGASTLAELALSAAPALLVPSPYVPNNHQEANARGVSAAGAADVVTERECEADALYRRVVSLLGNADALRVMSAAQRARAAPDAARRIAEIVVSMRRPE